MKTKRAQNAIPEWYAKQNPAIAALVDFAAQNPGLEFGNYGDVRSYKEEQRNISKDWRRFKDALAVCVAEGVTDAHVIAEAPHAFSGRLEWVTNYPTYPHQYWDYCTGQYWPTEYRKAAATLLEYATRRLRQERPPAKERIESIAQLKALNAQNGGCWFSADTMRFFGTRIESGIIRGKYFITSEQPPHDVRKFSVRSFNDEGDIDTIGEFCAYRNKREAIAAIPKD
jgi:hypothetical protein